jgi:hypothetical protein
MASMSVCVGLAFAPDIFRSRLPCALGYVRIRRGREGQSHWVLRLGAGLQGKQKEGRTYEVTLSTSVMGDKPYWTSI